MAYRSNNIYVNYLLLHAHKSIFPYFRALLKATEKKLDSKESAVSALKDQLEYLKVQNRETEKLKQENESLKNKMQTLTG